MTNGIQPTSKRRLSEVSKHLIIPRDIAGSYWPRVRPTCNDKLGITLDRWQDDVCGLALAKHADGTLAHTVGGFGLSICRQTGKTYSLAALNFSLCVEYPGLLVIWSAHHSATHDETFMAMQGFAARTKIEPFIEKVYTGSGDEEVRFHNGSRILFGAREHGFGRGIPGVDVLINDEGQILSQRAMDNMLATMNTSRLGLHVYAGTPPRPENNSDNWLRMRDEALSGESTDLAWVEFGADDGCDLDDQEQWKKANPSYPHRTPFVAFKRLRKKLDDDGFRREALGLYDENEGSVFDIARWAELVDFDTDMPGQAALVIDVSPDRRWSSIGIAGEIQDDERILIMCHTVRGTNKVVAKLLELQESRDIIDVSITSGAARALEADLVKEGVDYDKLSINDMSAAYNTLQKAIKDGTLCHVDQPELNTAIEMAKTRVLQTGESEAFDRRGYSVDISPAVACAGALYRFGLLQAPMPIIL